MRWVGGGKGEEVRRSKPKRMLSCAGMLEEFDFLVRHNNIHMFYLIVLLLCKKDREKGEKAIFIGSEWSFKV